MLAHLVYQKKYWLLILRGVYFKVFNLTNKLHYFNELNAVLMVRITYGCFKQPSYKLNKTTNINSNNNFGGTLAYANTELDT